MTFAGIDREIRRVELRRLRRLRLVSGALGLWRALAMGYFEMSPPFDFFPDDAPSNAIPTYRQQCLKRSHAPDMPKIS